MLNGLHLPAPRKGIPSETTLGQRKFTLLLSSILPGGLRRADSGGTPALTALRFAAMPPKKDHEDKRILKCT